MEISEHIDKIAQWAENDKRSALIITTELVDNQPIMEYSVVAKDFKSKENLTVGLAAIMLKNKQLALIMQAALNVCKKNYGKDISSI